MWLIETKILGGNWDKYAIKNTLDEALETVVDPHFYDHRVRRISDVQKEKDSSESGDSVR